jgi:hypothetical protein
MDRLKIFWTSTAVSQRDYVLNYWNDRNKNNSYSQKLIYKIRQRINLLKASPHLGKLTEYKDTRVISLGHYNIFYKTDNFKIVITGFWDNRQNPKKLLRFLKDKD